MKDRRIAIIGGGPGGLALARILQTRGLAATIFEREEWLGDRAQGGTLDLHPETGQYALQLAGLEAEFRAVARFEDQGIRLYDSAGVLHFADAGSSFAPGEDRPEIDRVTLRRLLLDALRPGVVRWGHKLQRVEPAADGTHTLTFDTGPAERFDLVVGADGTWSRVRPLVSPAVPEYSGVTFFELCFEDVDASHPSVAELVGRGMMFALGDNRALIAQRNGHAQVRLYVALRVPADWVAAVGLDLARPAAAKAALAAWFAGWAPELVALIAEASERIIPWKIHALPIGHRWETRAGLTLIGDAAHVMSPFSGQGANLALRDAADLAVALAETADWLGAVRDFEATMAARATVAAGEAAGALDATIATEGLEHVLDHFREQHATTH